MQELSKLKAYTIGVYSGPSVCGIIPIPGWYSLRSTWLFFNYDIKD